MSKNDVLKEIKKLNFNQDIYLLLDLIEKNLESVEFVKDHNGLENFIFIAEKEATKFESPLFARFNQTNSRGTKSVSESLIFDLNEIVNHFKEVLTGKRKKIYIEIGFKDSALDQEDRFKAYQMLKKKEMNNIQDALIKLKKFPDWYKASFSKDVRNYFEFLSEMESVEKRLLHKLKSDLKENINIALKEENVFEFKELSKRYKKVCEEILK